MFSGSAGLDSVGGIWSLREQGSYCGVPLVPTVTSGFGADVIENVPGPRVWGWTPPGELAAAAAYGPRLIADVELASTNKQRPDAGWTGAEVDEAAAVASLVGGVTSHGFVLRQLRDVLGQFARRGIVAYPQVYDSDRSTEPRAFLRQCVEQYRAVGFREVRPLLGLSAGPDHLRAWLAECRSLGVRPDLWSLARAREMQLCSGPRPSPSPQPSPSGGRVPTRADPADVPASGGEWGGFVLLLVVAGLVYRSLRSPA